MAKAEPKELTTETMVKKLGSVPLEKAVEWAVKEFGENQNADVIAVLEEQLKKITAPPAIESLTASIRDLRAADQLLNKPLYATIASALKEVTASLLPAEEAPARKARLTVPGGKRTRRSRAEIEADATEILNMLRAAGKSGLKADAIRAKFPKVGPSITGFIREFGKAELRTEGPKKDTTYFAP